eukprot:SAG11_NODE_6085_length_1391_cov_1.339009_2_plen_85_part_00
MGVQTTATAELVVLAEAAEKLGVDYMQVSPPFYFASTEADFIEYVQAAAAVAPSVGIILCAFYFRCGVYAFVTPAACKTNLSCA